MTDQLKLIVSELNNEPFSKHYNLISFDSLEPQELLQVLSDVFCTIEKTPPIDIRQEPPDETALRLFTSLRIMKFRPPMEAEEISSFRQGLVEGEKQAVYPVLEWVLQRFPELQQRAYLAKYLVKVDIPPELYGDPEVQELAGQCDELMESFKEIHREAKASKTEGLTAEDIRQDIHSMEQERETLIRRIDKLKRKTENIPQKDKLMTLAAQLRAENETATALEHQKHEQRNGLVHAEQKIQRLVQLIRETKKEADSRKPEDLIHKLQEENKVQKYMVEEKLPKEVASKRKAVQELQKVVSQPAMQKSDLDEINEKIQEVNEEITKLVQQKNLQYDPTEDKIAIFKQQATIVERKKETAAEKLQEARQELQNIETEVREKKNQMKDPEGNEIVTSVQFKNYVNKLRSKTNVYKKKRSELQDLRAEIGVLARTEEILKSQLENLRKTVEGSGGTFVEEDEDDDVIMGGPIKPTARPMTAKIEGKSLNELKEIVENLDAKLEQKRMELNPILQELRPLRDQFQDVKRLRNEINEADSIFFRLDTEKLILQALIERAEEESQAENLGGKSSFRDKLQAKIQASEEEGKRLREEQKNIGNDQQEAARQMKLWRDFMKIMECKKSIFLQNHPNPGSAQGQRVSSGTDRGVDSPASAMGSARSGVPGSRMSSGRPQSRQREF